MSKAAKVGRPSPAIVVAVVALVAALAGTAIAGPTATTSISKKSVKKTAKKEAAKYFDANIGGASVASADSASSADNASQLGGQSPSTFRTASASDQRTNSVALSDSSSTILSKTITLPSTKTVTAVASVEAVLDDDQDNGIECNLVIAGTGGTSHEQDLPLGEVEHASVPLTQSRTLGAGTHTVLVECSRTVSSPDVFVEDRSLSVVATG